jgi:penicillin V acylase-like amidase (Ntn superfamily)
MLTMTKRPAFERGLTANGEYILLSLFKTKHGFSLERRIVEKDQVASVQVLPITELSELSRFAFADPYSKELAVLYYEVKRHLVDSGMVK